MNGDNSMHSDHIRDCDNPTEGWPSQGLWPSYGFWLGLIRPKDQKPKGFQGDNEVVAFYVK